MFLKFQISCACHCKYSVNENIDTDKIICPNCNLEYPYSAKVLSILKTAKEIPDNEVFGETSIKVISAEEDMNDYPQ